MEWEKWSGRKKRRGQSLAAPKTTGEVTILLRPYGLMSK